MKKWFITCLMVLFCVFPNGIQAQSESEAHQMRELAMAPLTIPERMARFTYDSGYHFTYPDAVRGVYVTGYSAGGAKFDSLTKLLDDTDLNSMVIDIKDDSGYITFELPEDHPDAKYSRNFISDPEAMMKTLEEKEIYPIARIVVFKDTVWAEDKPEVSFTQNGQVWTNGSGDAFVNPFMKEVWERNVAIAEEAAKMGFQEIQFDYVRFPEGFETRDEELTYSLGDYQDGDADNVQKRVNAVTDFVAYAREELSYYDVDVSVDIFGYAATLPEAPGIGQNFSKISENVDVISSMIYPSHWTSYFGIAKPDLEPYNLVDAYAKVENKKLAELNDPPVSRPWIQDFTASWLGSGNYLQYGKQEVEAQIKALQDNGINEYLLWNASNRYTENVDFTP
ncbi:putative glycoside hydrolase [Bacillaceae bacterium SIJ1]|uniref:putative glycoside hydrolase n=1 Tax=Litoribacterium kuwaitense TaxID=1398745 RepID=UPI0013EACC70|nr:putative glycoside hydrolase [Litoribacterium kuwaitense]NGP44574.1 putative glycoside hydrolase [Litoribacterium kuwaitense]